MERRHKVRQRARANVIKCHVGQRENGRARAHKYGEMRMKGPTQLYHRGQLSRRGRRLIGAHRGLLYAKPARNAKRTRITLV